MISLAIFEHRPSMILGWVSTSWRPSWYLTLTAACLSRGILIWQDPRQRWNSSSCSSWFTSFDFAVWAASRFRMEVSSSNELIACKNSSIYTGRKCLKTILSSLRIVPRLQRLIKDVLKSASTTRFLTTPSQARTQRSQVITNLGMTPSKCPDYFVPISKLTEVTSLTWLYHHRGKSHLQIRFWTASQSCKIASARSLFARMSMEIRTPHEGRRKMASF